MKGQLSVEMLVVLVVILGIVALVASTLMNSANQAAGQAKNRTTDTLGTCARNDVDTCTKNSDCCSNFCDLANTGRCAKPYATS